MTSVGSQGVFAMCPCYASGFPVGGTGANFCFVSWLRKEIRLRELHVGYRCELRCRVVGGRSRNGADLSRRRTRRWDQEKLHDVRCACFSLCRTRATQCSKSQVTSWVRDVVTVESRVVSRSSRMEAGHVEQYFASLLEQDDRRILAREFCPLVERRRLS